MSHPSLRTLPSVDRLLRAVDAADLPHDTLVQVARALIDETRALIVQGQLDAAPDLDDLAATAVVRVRQMLAPSLRPAINASGVIIQTNLGRAPLSDAALAAIAAIGRDSSNLEYDLDAGERGSRYGHLTALLARLTGTEAALVVNNNAAAVLLTLSCFCHGREVIVSRGQAVEIGGGFRIPDVLQQSGARLVEVGTTNRTYTHDYAAAITPGTAAILTVHRSNFRLLGFTHDPLENELHHLTHEAGLLWIDDWGSGSLLRPERYGLAAEDVVQDRVAEGCDLVCFSGDKLLGGPQAGLIVGRAELIGRLRKHPLLRALRVDKTTIAALEATLLSYARGRAEQEIPVWQMISATPDDLRARAAALAEQIQASGHAVDIVACQSAIGGGSLPGELLSSWAVALPGTPDRLHARLRQGDPAVVGRIVDDRLLLDLRTVRPAQDRIVYDAVVRALGNA